MFREPIARLPVFGWRALQGARAAGLPGLLDSERVHFTTSGRAAILLALEALGVKPGHRVLLPTYHCPTMVSPAHRLGAVPAFYPIDACGRPILEWLEQQDLQGVRVMLAAHYFGLPQPMAQVRRWCDQRGIALIEDCAHALFGHSGGAAYGSAGTVAIGSLTKFLPVPEGGCLVFNNPLPEPRLAACPAGQHLRAAVDILDVGATQGALPGLNGLIAGGLGLLRRLRGGEVGSGPKTIVPPPPTHGTAADLALPDFQLDTRLAHRAPAAPCRWAARHLPRERIVQQRRLHYERLRRQLTGLPGLHPLRPELPESCAPYVFPLWVEEPDPGYLQLLRGGMPLFRWDRRWPGIPAMPGDQGLLWSHHVVQVACHQDLATEEVDRIAAALREAFGGSAAGTPAAPSVN